jgi:hypothetical protein
LAVVTVRVEGALVGGRIVSQHIDDGVGGGKFGIHRDIRAAARNGLNGAVEKSGTSIKK